MLDRRMEDRRKEDRRIEDRQVAKKNTRYKEFRLGTLLISIIIVVSAILISGYYISNMKNKKAIDNIKLRHSGKYSCNLTFEGNNNGINVGETAVFDIKVSNINAEDGVIMLEGLLDYDYRTFECNIVDIENGKWHKLSMLEDYFTIVRDDLMPSSENQTIGRLSVKLREQVQPGTYQIILKEGKFTMKDNKDFALDEISIPITVN